uniref:Ig-like domain-containing protein n=1 Tax=Leptobrachium leishanense TaxID=445787 RepID=A0A8C5QU84_9ANUR
MESQSADKVRDKGQQDQNSNIQHSVTVITHAGISYVRKIFSFSNLHVTAFIISLYPHTGALLKISTSSPQRAIAGSDVLLHCTFSGQGSTAVPRFLVIMWFYQGKEIVRYHDKLQISHPRVSFDKRAARNGNASILLSGVKIKDEGIYSCVVIYNLERVEADIMLDVLGNDWSLCRKLVLVVVFLQFKRHRWNKMEKHITIPSAVSL